VPRDLLFYKGDPFRTFFQEVIGGASCFKILIITSGFKILTPAITVTPLLKKASGIMLAVGPTIAVRLPLLIEDKIGSMVWLTMAVPVIITSSEF